MLSELRTENWIMSQLTLSNKKYKMIESSQTKKEKLLEN